MATFTKRHYLALSETLSRAVRVERKATGDIEPVRLVVRLIADMLEGDNHQFDRRRFVVNCGLESDLQQSVPNAKTTGD